MALMPVLILIALRAAFAWSPFNFVRFNVLGSITSTSSVASGPRTSGDIRGFIDGKPVGDVFFRLDVKGKI